MANTQAALDRIIAKYSPTHGIDNLDGITVTGKGYWFNVRPSNTEPLLRLNVEAGSPATLTQVTHEVQGVISAQ